MEAGIPRVSFDRLDDVRLPPKELAENGICSKGIDFTPRRMERIKSSYLEMRNEVTAMIQNSQRPKRAPRNEEDLSLNLIYCDGNDETDSSKPIGRSRSNGSVSGGDGGKCSRKRASSRNIEVEATKVDPIEDTSSFFTNILTSAASLGAGIFTPAVDDGDANETDPDDESTKSTEDNITGHDSQSPSIKPNDSSSAAATGENENETGSRNKRRERTPEEDIEFLKEEIDELREALLRGEESRIKLIEEHSDEIATIEAEIREKEELFNQLESDLYNSQARVEETRIKCISLELRCEELAIVAAAYNNSGDSSNCSPVTGGHILSASGASVVSPSPPTTSTTTTGAAAASHDHTATTATVTPPHTTHTAAAVSDTAYSPSSSRMPPHSSSQSLVTTTATSATAAVLARAQAAIEELTQRDADNRHRLEGYETDRQQLKAQISHLQQGIDSQSTSLQLSQEHVISLELQLQELCKIKERNDALFSNELNHLRGELQDATDRLIETEAGLQLTLYQAASYKQEHTEQQAVSQQNIDELKVKLAHQEIESEQLQLRHEKQLQRQQENLVAQLQKQKEQQEEEHRKEEEQMKKKNTINHQQQLQQLQQQVERQLLQQRQLRMRHASVNTDETYIDDLDPLTAANTIANAAVGAAALTAAAVISTSGTTTCTPTSAAAATDTTGRLIRVSSSSEEEEETCDKIVADESPVTVIINPHVVGGSKNCIIIASELQTNRSSLDNDDEQLEQEEEEGKASSTVIKSLEEQIQTLSSQLELSEQWNVLLQSEHETNAQMAQGKTARLQSQLKSVGDRLKHSEDRIEELLAAQKLQQQQRYEEEEAQIAVAAATTTSVITENNLTITTASAAAINNASSTYSATTTSSSQEQQQPHEHDIEHFVSELVTAKLHLAHYAHLADDEKHKAKESKAKLLRSEQRIKELESALAVAEEEARLRQQQQPKGMLSILRGR